MLQQINIGAAPNDGTGDDLRTAFEKVNALIALFTDPTSWTPTLTGAGSNPAVTYGARAGRYARVGPLLWVYCRVDWTSSSGGAGDLGITGLPVSPDNAGGSAPPVLPARTLGITWPGGGRTAIYAQVAASGSISLLNFGSGVGPAALQADALGSSGSIIVSGVCLIA